ncbi:MAG: TIGR04211 family SH3 domain-containing protein [Desulfuromonas sp.]|nr:TIGR04211 family SH3 domain-containing protein [Desulfuromonas sp.]
MKARWQAVVLILMILFTASSAWSDTRYVSDRLVITLREGMGNQFKVSKTLKTDERMEVLSEQDNYLFVRMDDGTEGYVLKQYVSRNTPKTAVIAKVRQELEAFKAKLKKQTAVASVTGKEGAQMRLQLSETTQSLALTEELLENSQKALAELQQKAENVVLIDQERQRLKKELAVVNQELGQLQQDNAAMLKTAMIKWFLAGGGVLFIGWVAGKFSRKKRRSLGGF